MANENKYLCCGVKIWTTVVGSLELVGCLLFGVLGLMTIPSAAPGINGLDGEKKTIVQAILYISIAILVIVNVLLLVGNEKERAGMLIPWLVIGYIFLVLTVVAIIRFFVLGQIPPALSTMAGLPITALFLLAVQLRYKEIKANGSSAQANPMV